MRELMIRLQLSADAVSRVVFGLDVLKTQPEVVLRRNAADGDADAMRIEALPYSAVDVRDRGRVVDEDQHVESAQLFVESVD